MLAAGVKLDVSEHAPPAIRLIAPELLVQSVELFTVSLKSVVSGSFSVRLAVTLPVESRSTVLGLLLDEL